MVHLAGIDEFVPLVAIEREAGNRQRLALRLGLLDPDVAAPHRIGAVTDLGYDAFQADLAGVLEHRMAVDLKGFAELDFGAGDDLLELGLAPVKRQLPQIAAVEVKEVEGDHDDLCRLPFEFVLQYRDCLLYTSPSPRDRQK